MLAILLGFLVGQNIIFIAWLARQEKNIKNLNIVLEYMEQAESRQMRIERGINRWINSNEIK